MTMPDCSAMYEWLKIAMAVFPDKSPYLANHDCKGKGFHEWY